MVYIKGINMKKKIIAAALAIAMSLTGCSLSTSSDNSGSSSKSSSSASFDAASYSLDELKAMIDEDGMRSEFMDKRTEKDYSDEAVGAYNSMLGYAESILGKDSYKLFDMYYVDETDDYVVKIVLNEFRNSKDTENAPIMLNCDKEGKNIRSMLEGFLYAREWTKQLEQEINETVPDYCHLNSYYLVSDHIAITSGSNTYDISDIGKTKPSGDWKINLILKAGTSKDSFEKNYEALKPVLDKYGVNEVNVLVPKDNDAYQKLLTNETITNNCYYFTEDGIDWFERNYGGSK
jgi:hypothetical protein